MRHRPTFAAISCSAAALGLALALSALPGCTSSPGSGAAAWLRVEGAEFRTDALPAAADGPKVVALTLTTNTAAPGERDKPLSGALDPPATVVAVGLEGDIGTWLLPAEAPLVEAPDYPTFSAALSFSPDLLPGEYTFFARAGDDRALFGPAVTAPISITAPPPPEGALVVSLFWDTEADLDLRVVQPDGVEIWKRNINSYEPPPPGEPADPAAWKKGALLDFDSNASCVIDGRRRENVIWKEAAPKGTFLVRVDTPSLCDAAAARWTAEVYREGERIARAQGQSTDTDTRAPHDRGAGVLALTFEVP